MQELSDIIKPIKAIQKMIAEYQNKDETKKEGVKTEEGNIIKEDLENNVLLGSMIRKDLKMRIVTI